MKTIQVKQKDIKHDWHLFDADGKVLGRLASEIARLLMGKNKTDYSPNMDMGDYVVVINAKKVEVTGKKMSQKVYRSHSGYPGGLKEVKFEKMITEMPQRVIENAVKGMLPKNRLLSERMKRLKVFAEKDHSYEDRFTNK